MTTIHAEIDARGQCLVLVAGGLDVDDVALAARRLKALTPLFSKSDPPGALTVPATWPAVVQLASTFGAAWRPGPRLQAWIGEQVTRRTSTIALCYQPPPGLTPYPWQVDGAALIAATGRALITDEPGCLAGDTKISVNRGGKGFTMTLRNLVARLNGDDARMSGRRWDTSIPTYVQREVDGVVRLGRIVNAWSSGLKQTYSVVTETGRTIRATDEHPFLTERGWLRLDQLVVGDLVHVRGKQSAGGHRIKPQYREIAGLWAHPYNRGAGRRTSRFRVAYHRLVAEARLNELDVDVFVKQIRTAHIGGLTFLDPAVWAVHHKDHDHLNNAGENLQVLTHSEHHRLHAEEGKTRSVLFKIDLERVVSIGPHGVEETYDLEVEDDPHNFIADGFVVHNTGKTITAILGLVEWGCRQLGEVSPVLVVCPASVVDPWVEAWRAWAPHVRTVAWRGTPKQRSALADTADVYVTSYETARADSPAAGTKAMRPLLELAGGRGPAALVVDECHLVKNPQAERSRAVRRLAKKATDQGGAVVALSGTPITHHPADLWPTLAALEPAAWPSRERWVNRYCEVVSGDYKDEILGLNPATEPEFRTTLLGQHRRVAKADVLSQLPPKVYSVRTVELPRDWRKVYDEFESQMLAELPDGTELAVMDVMSQFGHLSRLASAAADVEVTYGPDIDERTGQPKRHVHLDLKAPSWKVDALLEVLAERPGSPVVAFQPSRQLAQLAGAAAAGQGLKVGYVVGGQTQGERTRTVESFQAGALDLVCATTGAGGVGLTLTAARTVVFLQRPWSLVESLQAEDRCHRIGSERHDSIEIVDIVAKDTLDSRVRAVLRERAGQLADLVQDPRIVAELLGGSAALSGRRRTLHQPQDPARDTSHVGGVSSAPEPTFASRTPERTSA